MLNAMLIKIFFFAFLFFSCTSPTKVTLTELPAISEIHMKTYMVDLTGKVGFSPKTGEIINKTNNELYKVIPYMQMHKIKAIKIHSFFVEGGEYGFQSAVLRAHAVRRFLIENNVDKDKILTEVAYKKSKISTESVFQPLKISLIY